MLHWGKVFVVIQYCQNKIASVPTDVGIKVGIICFPFYSALDRLTRGRDWSI